ncbi:uncharacterized protein [Epargyreus clarus]|uniref:uncharacterized protein n=1 Tax=Epargyreus clarus TaxID=520877 RepID=UPI003C2EDB12
MYLYEKVCAINIVIVYLLDLCSCNSGAFNEDLLHRSRRQLLFPNSTLFQFNIGVGTPTPVKTININWAFQANFQLPWNRSQIPIDILEANTAYITEARKKRDVEEKIDGDYENDAKIYHFYKYVEDVLNGYGHNGTSCILRTLCQLGAEPLHTEVEDDLLHDLASFVLNPKNDASEPHGPSPESTPYIEAHEAGRNDQDCFSIYDNCSIPLIEIFTKILDSS